MPFSSVFYTIFALMNISPSSNPRLHLLSRLRVKILGRHEDIGPVRHPLVAGCDGNIYAVRDKKIKAA
jgi:hypothetical protein